MPRSRRKGWWSNTKAARAATSGKTDKQLWEALEGLDDDLLDPSLPEAVVDAELRAMGVDPVALAKRGAELAARATEKGRLAWQTPPPAQPAGYGRVGVGDSRRQRAVSSTRDKGTGRFAEEGKWDRLCTCGHALGVHTAAVVAGKRPCIVGDHGGDPCACERFKAAR